MLIDLPASRPNLGEIAPTRAQLASVFGTSVRWVGELRAMGVLPPNGATLADNVAAWTAYRASSVGGAANA